MILTLTISLFCCGLAIMLDYVPNEPKRHQMLLYWITKYFTDKRNRIEKNRDKSVKSLQGFCKQAIKDNPDKLELYITKEENETRLLNEIAEHQLRYEFYLKPIFLCVYCMPSFWGSIIYFGSGRTSAHEWIVTIIGAVFVNAVLWNAYLKISR